MSFDQSAFDPAAFLSQETTEAASKRPPLDPGEYTGVINELKPRAWQSKDGTKSGLAMDVTLAVEVPAEQQSAKSLEPTLKLFDSVFVDLVDGTGALDWAPGRNRGLRVYREATGQNVAGQPFSPAKLVGQAVKVKVTHELYNGDIQERVGGIAKL
jgi:hypothetical protein